MAYTQADLDALDAQIDLVRKTTFADGRSVEKQDLDTILKLRETIKAEVVAGNNRAAGSPRSTIGRVVRR